MTAEIHGTCSDLFLPLKEAFAANFADDLEVGASMAVTYQGRSVVDLWGGYADTERSQPWQKDTIVCVFSSTKVMLIACVLKLVAEGKIDLDVPVATYWPEFAQAGKSKTTTRQLLIHRAGLPGFSEPQPMTALHDWKYITELLASQEPWWEPGTQTCYHPNTYGFLLGEIVRRVSGRFTSEYFANEFARPANIDFHVGLKDPSLRERVAALIYPEYAEPPLEGVALRAWNSVIGGGEWQSWESQSAEIPSGNGHGNARSMARFGTILAMNGELDEQRYLPRKVIEMAISEQTYSECPMLGPIRLGLGFGLHCEEFPAPTPSAFHWGGFGGSLLVMDTNTGVSFAYAPNNMVIGDAFHDDERVTRLWGALGDVMADL